MAEEGEAAWKPIIRTLNDIQRFWKKTKTAYNPATHTGNFVSNIMLLDFAEVEFKSTLTSSFSIWSCLIGLDVPIPIFPVSCFKFKNLPDK